MADAKITSLTALTTPATVDLLAIIDDPGGTPLTKKITLANLLTLFLTNVTVQILTGASGTYTPTTGMKKALVIAVGGGGAGGDITAADEVSGGGGGGGTVIRLFTAAEIVGHDGYTVGQAATGAGSNTTFSSSPTLLTAGGGGIGASSGLTTTLGAGAAGGAGGTATGGDINIPGEAGARGVMYSTTLGQGGAGGRSVLGAGGGEPAADTVGAVGTAYGGGGSGTHTSADVDRLGGNGAAGVIYVIEFLNV
jgi:hypothetical protein